MNERNHFMSNIRKRMIAIAVVACMALTAVVGCSGNAVGKGGSVSKPSTSEGSGSEEAADNDTTTTLDPSMLVTPFQTGNSEDLAITDANAPSDATTAASAGNDSKATTAAATVTDASGKKVTATSSSQKGNDSYVATAGNGGNNNTDSTTAANSSDGDYKSNTDSMYCLWIDISKDENYVFNGQFLKITFKIKEGIPSKDYAVRFNPDFSSIAGASVHPDKVSQGTIRVGSGSIEANDVSSENGFVAYGDNIACKQGDTVDYYINLKNNPGLAAILVWFYYDKNAMEVTGIRPAGEFEDIAENGDIQAGTRPAN
jgi:hypothetical protein